MTELKSKLKVTAQMRKPVKAGSTQQNHGGFPTKKLIKIMSKKLK